MNHVYAYTIGAVGFAAAMALHAGAEDDPRLRRGKTRALITSPLWPAYLVAASIILARQRRH